MVEGGVGGGGGGERLIWTVWGGGGEGAEEAMQCLVCKGAGATENVFESQGMVARAIIVHRWLDGR